MMKPVYIREGTDNFFTPLRFVLAAMVVLGHGFVVVGGHPDFEPRLFYSLTPSYLAVNAFFVLSGFLVTQSMLRRKDLTEYAVSRFLRLMPGLAVHVLVLMLIVGPILTAFSLGRYVTDPDFYMQPVRVLSFFNTDLFLPGVFLDNPEPRYTSITLWTLRYEVIAYIGTALLFCTGFLRRRWLIGLQFLAAAALFSVWHRSGLEQQLPATLTLLVRFAVLYTLGAAIFAYRDQLPLRLWIIPALFVGAAAINGWAEFEILANIALAYTVLWLAFVKAPKLNFLRKIDDMSYGIYIYQWVILQTLVMVFPGRYGLFYSFTGLALSVLVGWLSWRLVEEPALKQKPALSAWLKKIAGRKGPAKTVISAE